MNPLLFLACFVLPNLISAKNLPAKNLAEVLSEDGRFSSLVTAASKADLVGALQGEGPLTILAPTDEAFSEVPNLGALLEDKAALTAVLQRHIVAAKVLSGDVTTGPVKTIGGETISAKVEDSKVTFSYGESVATVIQADIEASNGVIHVIDKVIA